jgi:hypothetical protein
MRIYVVTEMNKDMTYKKIHGATTDRETALNMAQVVMQDTLRSLTTIDIDKYIRKQIEYFDRSTRYGMNCIDRLNTVQITMFKD